MYFKWLKKNTTPVVITARWKKQNKTLTLTDHRKYDFFPHILGCIWPGHVLDRFHESRWCGCNSVCQSFLLVCAAAQWWCTTTHDHEIHFTPCVQTAVISVTCMWSTYDSAVRFRRRLLKRGKITVTHLLRKHTITPDRFDYMTHSPQKMELCVWGRETHWQSISIHLVLCSHSAYSLVSWRLILVKTNFICLLCTYSEKKCFSGF